MEEERPIERFLDFVAHRANRKTARLLQRLEVFDFDELLRVTPEDIADQRGFGVAVQKDVQALQGQVRFEMPELVKRRSRGDSFERLVQTQLSPEATEALRRMGIRDFTGLLSLQERELRNREDCPAEVAVELLVLVDRLLRMMEAPIRTSGQGESGVKRWPMLPPIDPQNPYSGISKWVKALVRHSPPQMHERNETIFRIRIGIDQDPEGKPTLERLARRYRVSRERIRQVVDDAIAEASHVTLQAALAPLFRRAADVVRRHGGQLTKEEFVAMVLARGRNGSRLRRAFPLVECFAQVPEWQRQGLTLSKAGVISAGNNSRLRTALRKRIVRIARETATQRLSARRWSVEWSVLKDAATEFAKTVPGYETLEGLSDSLLAETLEHSQVRERIRRYGERVFSIDLWVLRFGGATEAVEAILYAHRGTMHFTEVWEEARRWRPRQRNQPLTARSAHGALERARNALLWGNGTFIHTAWAPWPEEVIREMEQWLVDHIPPNESVSACDVFETFADKLMAADIPTAKAFYSCLRRLESPRLRFTRFPHVFVEKS